MHASIRDLMLRAARTGSDVVFDVTRPLYDLFPSYGSYIVLRPAGERLITVEREVTEEEFGRVAAMDPAALMVVSPRAAASCVTAYDGLPWPLDGLRPRQQDQRARVRLVP